MDTGFTKEYLYRFILGYYLFVFLLAETVAQRILNGESRADSVIGIHKTTGASESKTAAMVDRFEGIDSFAKTAIPVSNEGNPKLAPLDEAVLAFMANRGVPALTLAVSKNGQVIHERSFGWGDAALKIPLPPGRPFRLASNSKPLVKALIRQLAEEKKLQLGDKVFDLLGLAALVPKNLDARWKDITVQHLIDHQGGWDREKSPLGDFATHSSRFAADLRIPLRELKPMHLVTWALGQPLDFTPGERDAYGNFGYVLLARIAEKVTGQSFLEALRETIGKKCGMTTLGLSRTDAKDRAPDEMWYCQHPQFIIRIDPLPFRLEPLDGSSAVTCTAADYCRFMEHYELSGVKRAPGFHYRHSGRMPGTCSMAVRRQDGICFVFMANRSGPGGAAWEEEITEIMEREINRATGDL